MEVTPTVCYFVPPFSTSWAVITTSAPLRPASGDIMTVLYRSGMLLANQQAFDVSQIFTRFAADC